MNIYSVYDDEFRSYGRVVFGMEDAIAEILAELEKAPLPKETLYVPEDPILQSLPSAEDISRHLYGGLPVQLGRCSGHNQKLNCLEYHRDSEFNAGTEEFILLLAKQWEIENGTLDTAKVRAFRVPAGVLVECFATTLHYAPCHADAEKGFRVLVVLPKGTNLDVLKTGLKCEEDKLLWASNKWLLAHPDSAEAKQGAYVGLVGQNIEIK